MGTSDGGIRTALIFAGAARFKTEVRSTKVFMELSISSQEAAVAVSLIMVMAAIVVLIVARVWGSGRFFGTPAK